MEGECMESSSQQGWIVTGEFNTQDYLFLYKQEDKKFPSMFAGVVVPQEVSRRILHWLEKVDRPQDVLSSPEFRGEVLVVVKGTGEKYRVISFERLLSSLKGYRMRLGEEGPWIREVLGEWGRRGRRWNYSVQDLTRVCVFRRHYSVLPVRETYLLLNIPLILDLFGISRPPYYFLLEKLGKKLREGGIEE